MMADNYKILAQDTAESIEENSGENQANVLYTVPENTQASISSVSLINTAEENVEYSLGVVKAEDVDSSAIFESADRKFIAVSANSQGSYSSDGIAWVTSQLPQSFIPASSISVTYGNGKFVAVPSGPSAAYSFDGITWTLTSTTAGNWGTIVYGNGKFIAFDGAISPADRISYSADAISWTEYLLPALANWKSATYADGKFVAVGWGSDPIYSIDGISWTLSISSIPGNQAWQSVTYGDGKFVALALDSDTVAYSTDGANWTTTTSLLGAWKSVTYGDGKFVAVANGYSAEVTYGTQRAAYSTDAINWIATTLSLKNWTSVAYGNGKFVAVSGNSSSSAYSTDGISWTEEVLPSSSLWNSVAYGELSPGSQVNTISEKQTIIPARSIEPNVVDEVVGGITLSEGDQIRIYSESPDLIAQVYGVEIA
jgi:hypothetical protein